MFDARAIKLLEAGKHLTSDDCPGLRVVASARGKAWIYRYRSPVDRAIRQIKLGAWPAMSVAAAVLAWEAVRQQRDKGIDPVADIRAARAEARARDEAAKAAVKIKSVTVAEVCDVYWHRHILANRKPKGQTEVRRMFDKMLGDLATAPAAELSRAQAFDLIAGHAATRPVVAGYLRSELGAAWDYAIDSGRLPESCPNWWRLILRGKLRSKGKQIGGEYVGTAKRVLSDAEVGALIRWLPNFSALIEDALTMYLWTACRGAEILAMEGRELRQEAGGQWWWVIPKAKTKNMHRDKATDLRVPLFGRALAVALRRRDLHGDGYLFPARTRDGRTVPTEQKVVQSGVWMRQPYSQTRPDEPRSRLPVTHWAPHDLRRTSRTMLAAMGCPGEVAEAILGHVPPGIVGVYNQHRYDAERVEWLRRLSERLEGVV